jgi:hypothetical protein
MSKRGRKRGWIGTPTDDEFIREIVHEALGTKGRKGKGRKEERQTQGWLKYTTVRGKGRGVGVGVMEWWSPQTETSHLRESFFIA